MGTVPTNYTWMNGDKPDFRQMELRVSDMADFLYNPPMVRLRKTNAQSFANSVRSAVSWNFVEVENTNMWDAAQPTRITPSVPGWYIGSAGVSFIVNATGIREVDVVKNGSATATVIRVKSDPTTAGIYTTVVRGNLFLESFNGTTDYIEVTGWQNSGGSLGINAATFEQAPEVSLRWFAAL